MQNLNKIIREAKRLKVYSEQQTLNLVREYVQVLILKAIYQSKYGRALSFCGGTCLRICYALRRYSEDLDFCLDENVSGYSFKELNTLIDRFLKRRGFDIHLHVREDKVVQKSFVRLANIIPMINPSARENQKLHVKLEVDTRPIPVSSQERETFFVTKFDENFPILKHTDETLFAGKILAILNRAYTKGRDYYDLVWHMGHKTTINLEYLNKGLVQQGNKVPFKSSEDVLKALEEKVGSVSPVVMLKDIGPFLEDPEEEKWIRDYPQYFQQMVKQYRY